MATGQPQASRPVRGVPGGWRPGQWGHRPAWGRFREQPLCKLLIDRTVSYGGVQPNTGKHSLLPSFERLRGKSVRQTGGICELSWRGRGRAGEQCQPPPSTLPRASRPGPESAVGGGWRASVGPSVWVSAAAAPGWGFNDSSCPGVSRTHSPARPDPHPRCWQREGPRSRASRRAVSHAAQQN